MRWHLHMSRWCSLCSTVLQEATNEWLYETGRISIVDLFIEAADTPAEQQRYAMTKER